MPHGSDPRRRPDQQSPDSGASVPPTWWSALSDTRLPVEGLQVRRKASWLSRLRSLAVRLSTPALVLAVAGVVVAAGFGYQILAAAVGAGLVLSLAVVTLIHHRRSQEVEDTGWWR